VIVAVSDRYSFQSLIDRASVTPVVRLQITVSEQIQSTRLREGEGTHFSLQPSQRGFPTSPRVLSHHRSKLWMSRSADIPCTVKSVAAGYPQTTGVTKVMDIGCSKNQTPLFQTHDCQRLSREANNPQDVRPSGSLLTNDLLCGSLSPGELGLPPPRCLPYSAVKDRDLILARD
jgi:hypothetical protein